MTALAIPNNISAVINRANTRIPANIKPMLSVAPGKTAGSYHLTYDDVTFIGLPGSLTDGKFHQAQGTAEAFNGLKSFTVPNGENGTITLQYADNTPEAIFPDFSGQEMGNMANVSPESPVRIEVTQELRMQFATLRYSLPGAGNDELTLDDFRAFSGHLTVDEHGIAISTCNGVRMSRIQLTHSNKGAEFLYNAVFPASFITAVLEDPCLVELVIDHSSIWGAVQPRGRGQGYWVHSTLGEDTGYALPSLF